MKDLQTLSNNPLQCNIDDYLRFLPEQKRYSSFTIKNYQRQLKRLLSHLQELNLAKWEQLKPIHIRQLSAQQNRQRKSAKSTGLLLSSCRIFFHYLLDFNLISINPAKNLRPTKGEKRLPKTMDVEQLSMLQHNIDTDEEIGIKDKAHPRAKK